MTLSRLTLLSCCLALSGTSALWAHSGVTRKGCYEKFRMKKS